MTRPLDIKKKESCVMLRFWLLTQNYSLDFMLLLNVHEVMFYLVYFIDLLIYLPPLHNIIQLCLYDGCGWKNLKSIRSSILFYPLDISILT